MRLHRLGPPCVLFVLCTLAASAQEVSQWKIGPASTPSAGGERSERRGEFLITSDKPRDKRALGLILSGLAQVFGYTVNPVQLASLQNADASAGRAATVVSNATGPASPQPQNQPTADSAVAANQTAPSRQRETIRFTGVVNFGNNSNLLNHLQEYERIFHGNGTSTPMPAATTVATTTPAPAPTLQPLVDPRTVTGTRPPLLAPLLVKIPLPILPDLPPPIIPTGDIKLSYPSVNDRKETVYNRNQGTERLTIEQKDLYRKEDVRRPPSEYTENANVAEPRWKKLYEDRLAELERKQEEHAERLRQQELHNKRLKEEDYPRKEVEGKYGKSEKARGEQEEEEEEEGPGYRGRGNGDYKDDYSGEEQDSRERYADEKKTSRPSSAQYANESGEGEEGKSAEVSRSKGCDKPYKQYENGKDSPLRTYNNHTRVRFNEQLPISDYSEKRNPGKLRNSYGEVLGSRELIEDGIADYFGKFVQSDRYYLPEETPKKGKSQEEGDEDEGSVEVFRKENKYEEYELNEKDQDGNDNRNSQAADDGFPLNVYKDTYKQRPDENNNSGEDNSEYSDKIRSQPQTSVQEENGNAEYNSEKYMPYFVPVRYLYAPDDPRRTNLKTQTREDQRIEAARDQKINEDDFRPKIPPPQSLLPKQLHVAEEKQLQYPVPPFDFVFDSTEQTNFVSLDPPNYTNQKDLPPCQTPARSSHPEAEFFLKHEIPIGARNAYAQPHEYTQEIYYAEDDALHGLPDQSQDNRRLNPAPSSYKKATLPAKPQRAENLPTPGPQYTIHGYDMLYYQNNNQQTVPVQSEIPGHRVEKGTSHFAPEKYQQPYQYQISAPVQAPVRDKGVQNTNPRNYNNQQRPQRSKKPEQQATATQKPKMFSDPQSAHDFFGFSRNDYSFEDNGKQQTQNVEPRGSRKEEEISSIAPSYEHENGSKFAADPDTETGNVRVKEYANKIATLKVSEQKQSSPNGPITYVGYTRRL